MNEQLIQKRHKASYLWIACGFLFSELNASTVSQDSDTLVVESSLSLPEQIGNDQRRRRFCKDFLNAKFKVLFGASVRKGQELGRGGYGTVYEGSNPDSFSDQKKHPKPRRIIIKQGYFMNKEFKASKDLLDTISAKLNQEGLEYGKIIGFGNIVPVIAQTQDGSLIQEMVQGKDLYTTLRDGLGLYNLSGYPNDLQQALELLASFFAGLIAIHDCEFVHCDIKPQNVMVQNSVRGYSYRIIDLGTMKKFGKKMCTCSWNGDPKSITLYLKHNYLRSQINGKWRFDDPIQREEYKSLRMKYDSIPIPTAQLSFDMCSATGILLSTVFGKKGLEWSVSLYFPPNFPTPEENPKKSSYAEMAQDPNFDANNYFIKKFSYLNKQMKEATIRPNNPAGLAYPQPMLKRLARLQAKLSSLDPDERFSAIEVFEEVQGMALAPYWTKIKTGKPISQKDYFLDIQW
ncbi:MAG: protein kinase [Puniceicoccales bacterium]|jgi:serine/threonine protein kinase|nr:protein kinase [Puniceicoccales bacterium]